MKIGIIFFAFCLCSAIDSKASEKNGIDFRYVFSYRTSPSTPGLAYDPDRGYVDPGYDPDPGFDSTHGIINYSDYPPDSFIPGHNHSGACTIRCLKPQQGIDVSSIRTIISYNPDGTKTFFEINKPRDKEWKSTLLAYGPTKIIVCTIVIAAVLAVPLIKLVQWFSAKKESLKPKKSIKAKKNFKEVTLVKGVKTNSAHSF